MLSRTVKRHSGLVRTLATAAEESFRVVCVGAGPGGLSVASSLSNDLGAGKVAVIDANQHHVYQPMLTLVGGGVKKLEDTTRPQASCVPSKATWIQSNAEAFEPESNVVVTADGRRIKYDFLVVATGIVPKLDRIEGLREALEAPASPVGTNYIPQYAAKTWDIIRDFKGGEAVFSFPTGPVKCAGAPQKIMYLAEEHFRTSGVRDKTQVIYNTALGKIFGVDRYAEALRKICADRSIHVNYSIDLVRVDPLTREATFQEVIDGKPAGDEETFKYDMMHATPKMAPVDAVAQSPLANAAGFVDVDSHVLQHTKYDNVFSLGDCSSLPTSKTAAAISEQSGVLKANLRALMAGRVMPRRYNGYTSCPLVTGRNKLILAEFDYYGNPMETFPVNQAEERSSMYMLKRDAMPAMYWSALLKGLWEGPGTFRGMWGADQVV